MSSSKREEKNTWFRKTMVSLESPLLSYTYKILVRLAVELILTDPDGAIKQSRGKYIYYKKLKGRKDNLIAAVTLLKSKNEFDVITVMIDFEVE